MSQRSPQNTSLASRHIYYTLQIHLKNYKQLEAALPETHKLHGKWHYINRKDKNNHSSMITIVLKMLYNV